ncbi:unnamed protein product [Protopolystoma xenopodis]|uniref:Uncharacterized protein n=1 Tax=Protopolystoma xenopodis TaxID=117903 RepID=A0A3S5FH96_9PLAT|nr:unnamed protein product [Protopolystoma xenopodis]
MLGEEIPSSIRPGDDGGILSISCRLAVLLTHSIPVNSEKRALLTQQKCEMNNQMVQMMASGYKVGVNASRSHVQLDVPNGLNCSSNRIISASD